RADALALRDRRDQRLDALDLGLDLVGLAARHGHEQFAVEAAGDRGRLALPDLVLAGRLAFRVDAYRVEVLEAVVEQLLRLDRARRLRTGADDDRDQAPFTVEPRLLAARGRDQAIAGRFGVSGLHAVDARVDGQQAVAIRLADVVVRVVAPGVERVEVGMVDDQPGRKRREVARRRVMLGIRQPGRVAELRIAQPDALRLAIHLLGEGLLAACERVGP